MFKHKLLIILFLILIFNKCKNNAECFNRINYINNCSDYSIKKVQHSNKKINLDIVINSNYYDPISETEFLFYFIRTNFANCETKEVDSISGMFTLAIRDSLQDSFRVIDFSLPAKQFFIEMHSKDSILAPYYHIFVTKLIQSGKYRDLVNWLSYIHGVETHGNNREQWHDDIFIFLYQLNLEASNRSSDKYLKQLRNLKEITNMVTTDTSPFRGVLLEYLNFLEATYYNKKVE